MKIIINKKIVILFISTVFLLIFSKSAFAIGPFPPGTEDNPQCLPSQINCDVIPAITTEIDPVFSTWLTITPPLYSYTETDPIFIASPAHNISSGDITNLSNLSGTNSGDNAINSLYSGLATSKQDLLVSGLNIKTINSASLLGSTDILLQTPLIAGTNYEVPLTFGSGLTRTVNAVANNLITGLAGGQTIIGGTGVDDGLTYKSTTGAGTTTGIAHQFVGGTNGGTIIATMLNNGNVGIGTTTPVSKLQIKAVTTLSGTSSINGTTTVTGVGTSYIKEANVGEDVIINGETRIINVIYSATSFGVTVAFTTTVSGQIVTITNDSNTFFSGGYSTFSSANGVTTEINTNNGGTYGIRSSSVIKGSQFYLFGATGGIYTSGGVPLFYQAAGNLFGMGATNTVSKLDVIQPTAGVGTVSNSASGITVTGVGTVFTDTFKIGDTITATGGTSETRTISAIASNTSMTTDAWTNAHAASAYTLIGGTRFSVKGNGNVGIGTTSPLSKLSINGGLHVGGDSDAGDNNILADGTITSNSFVGSSLINFGVSSVSANTVIGPTSVQVASSPIAGLLWHDLLAFNKLSTPTFETYNGTTWTSATLDKRLFAEIENQSINVIDTAVNKGVRWTWSGGLQWSQGEWLVIGFAWSASYFSATLTFEKSTDGTTWTTVHSSTGTWNANPYWFYVPALGTEQYYRLSITTTSTTGSMNLSSIRLLTRRMGDQGAGSELSVPYTWDENRNIAFGSGAVAANGVATIGTNTTAATGGLYFGTDTNLYRSAANQFKTDDSLIVMGNVGIGTTTGLTAKLNLVAGTASVAPLLFNSGTLLTTPLAGTVEFLTDRYYGTITTGAERKQFAFTSDLSSYLPLAGGTMTGGITNSTSVNPLTTLAESWIGPSLTTGIYFKDGNVGIGTTTPGYLLHVGSASVTDATVLLRLQDADSTCDFTANTGTPSCGSDITLKKNINNQSDNLTKILSLRPVTYNWLTDEDGVEVKHGFIAQEVADIMPELVTDGVWIDGTTKKFLQTAGMTPYIIGAIKEMNLKLMDINNFDKENDWRDSLIAWFANAENRITRIFTGEICLTEVGEETICLNRTELQSLKALLNKPVVNQIPIVVEPVKEEPIMEPVVEPVTELEVQKPAEEAETTTDKQVTNQEGTSL